MGKGIWGEGKQGTVCLWDVKTLKYFISSLDASSPLHALTEGPREFSEEANSTL